MGCFNVDVELNKKKRIPCINNIVTEYSNLLFEAKSDVETVFNLKKKVETFKQGIKNLENKIKNIFHKIK